MQNCKTLRICKNFFDFIKSFFYGFWKIAYLPVLLSPILVNFFLAKRLLNNKIARGGRKNRFYFVLGVIFNLSLLGFFKYTDFLLENFNTFSKIANLNFDIPLPHILLSIALYFVTFQQIAFLYDCYKSRENLKMNFIDYALFISFFPQLIAGPIVHHREMMPQFAKMDIDSKNSKKAEFINYKLLTKGIFIFAIGLFKKFLSPIALQNGQMQVLVQ